MIMINAIELVIWDNGINIILKRITWPLSSLNDVCFYFCHTLLALCKDSDMAVGDANRSILYKYGSALDDVGAATGA